GAQGVALGPDGTAVAAAEAAVDAGGTAVVGDRVYGGGGTIGVVAQPLGGGSRDQRAVHVGPRRHGEGRRAPGRERVGAVLAGHPDQGLGLGVVGLELAVVEGPVG